MKNQRKKLLAIGLILLVIVLGIASVFVSSRLSSQKGVAPTAPSSRPQAAVASCPAGEQCPGSDGVLRSCSPAEAGGWTADSICNAAGRIEPCGGQSFCCPAAGGKWTTDMSACGGAAAPTGAAGTVDECGKCNVIKKCKTGFACDTVDGLCKKTDGSTVCYAGSSACTLSVTTACVADGTVTCTPDCPTECGLAASTITTCKDSCGVATTKACPATTACGTPELSIVKKAFWNEADNTAGNYDKKTEIDKVSKDQIFVYMVRVTNTSSVAVNDAVVTDTLDGQKQDLLTFVDTESKCSYEDASRKITCNNVDLAAGKSEDFSFRVKLTGNAVNGDVIINTGKVTYGSVTKEAKKNLTVSTIVGCSNACTTDEECGGTLVCDSTTKMCRAQACLTMTNCICPTATPTLASCNKACNEDGDCVSGLICDTATKMCRNEACVSRTNCTCITATATITATETVVPTTLPETGILDIPGVAAFGGGLMLAVIGILLAL